MPKAFTIRPYQAADQGAFASLNLAWIEEYFGVEPEDRRQLDNPQRTILDKGGAIFVADLDGRVVGTGAMIPAHSQPDTAGQWAEIVKMATDPVAQGLGVGGAILDQLILTARQKGIECLWLETNDRLSAATRLYASRGFSPLSTDDLWETPYSRCNMQMTLELAD
ncbi:MAG: GNAT family N-acetyltransferase [Pseudomonadota bacterium]